MKPFFRQWQCCQKLEMFFVIFVTFNLIGQLSAEGQTHNTFSEELVIKPLPSGHIHSHFEFTTMWYNKQISESIENFKDFKFVHYDLFPRALGEVVERYHVRELHLSLTQGLWRHHKWGYPIHDAAPGVQLWAWFNPTNDDLDQTWRDLVNALSGLFCASLNFIDSTNTVSPELTYRPQGLAEEWYSRNSSYMRYAALPRENVCTENLTPWKKLLPCDTRSGLSTLLHPAPLYAAHYHSLVLNLRPSCKDSDCTETQLELVQSLSVVQDTTKAMSGKQNWSLYHLFSSPISSVCPMAERSSIYVDITNNLNYEVFDLDPKPKSIEIVGNHPNEKHIAVYHVREMLDNSDMNIDGLYKKAHVYGIIHPPPLQVARFITGFGQEGGSITVKLTNKGSDKLSVVYLEVLPWYLRLFLHTSHSHHQMKSLYLSKLVSARDRERGWLYEAVVEVPAKSTVELSLEFRRALLKWLEYPPDANHGFYLPSATVSTILPNPSNVSVNNPQAVTLQQKLAVDGRPSFICIHTESLLVSLPTPDFSMPYNVICLACTVVALAFGPIHNITTKKLTLKKIEQKESITGKIKEKLRKLMFWKKNNVELLEQNMNTGNKEIASDTEEAETNEVVESEILPPTDDVIQNGKKKIRSSARQRSCKSER